MSTRARTARAGGRERAGHVGTGHARTEHDPVLALQAMAGNRGVSTLIGDGRPLPPPARERFGALLGQDLSGVRLHPHAPLGPDVLACAVGEHVALSPAVRALGPVRSAAVLAHELAHVVQQRRGGTRSTTAPGALESDAHHAAAAVVRGSPATVTQASAPGPAALTLGEARRKLWGLLPAPVQERVRPLAVQAAAVMDKVAPPTTELPGPAAAVVDRTVATASAAAPAARRATAAVRSAVQPGHMAAVAKGVAREKVMGQLGLAKGVALEAGNVADVLIGLPSTFQWAAGEGIKKAEEAGYLSKERADQARAVVAQSAADHAAITQWAMKAGILETDPDTGAPSVSRVIGGQFDRLADTADKAAFEGAAPESSVIFTSYEQGELTGAIGSQVALGFVGVEEVQLALKVVGLLGAVKGLLDEMRMDENWRSSSAFWLRVLGVVMSLVGLRSTKASGKVINLVMAAGAVVNMAAPMATLYKHWTDPALAKDPAQRDAMLKRDFTAVAKAVVPMIIDVVRQGLGRGSAGPPRKAGGAPRGEGPASAGAEPAVAAPQAIPSKAGPLPKGGGRIVRPGELGPGVAANDVEPPSVTARSAKPVARTGTDDVAVAAGVVPALKVIGGGRTAASTGAVAARPPAAVPPVRAPAARVGTSGVPAPPIAGAGGGGRTGGSRGGATPSGSRRTGGAGPQRRLGGATAEGAGGDFAHRRFGAVRTPPTEFIGRPGAAARPLAAHSEAPGAYRVERVSLDRRSPHYWDRPGAGTVPQPGTVLEFPNGVRVWREQPGGPIRHEAPLSAGIGRAGAERGHYTATEHGGLAPGPRMQRAHTLGQGTGFESPYGIYYAPEFVNQQLQNHGIESYMRALAARRRSGETFRVVTTTEAHGGTRRLSSIEYRLQAIVDGEVHHVATYRITVGGTQAQPLVQAQPIRFADNPVARTIQESVPQPPVITQAVRHVADGSAPSSATSGARRRIVGQRRATGDQPPSAEPAPAQVAEQPAASHPDSPESEPPAPATATATTAVSRPAPVEADGPRPGGETGPDQPAVRVRIAAEEPPDVTARAQQEAEAMEEAAALEEKALRRVMRRP